MSANSSMGDTALSSKAVHYTNILEKRVWNQKTDQWFLGTGSCWRGDSKRAWGVCEGDRTVS